MRQNKTKWLTRSLLEFLSGFFHSSPFLLFIPHFEVNNTLMNIVYPIIVVYDVYIYKKLKM